jgi:hypothetical protein
MRELTSKELKNAIRNKYAWPGGYEIFGIASDGSVICCDCMHKEYRQIAYARMHNLTDGWRIDAITCTAECEDLTICEHCNRIVFDNE